MSFAAYSLYSRNVIVVAAVVVLRLLLLTVSTLKSQNAMYNHKWTHKQTNKKVRTIHTNDDGKNCDERGGNKAADTISVKSWQPQQQMCSVCECIFINCFMSRRYSMSLKHACCFPLALACVCVRLHLCLLFMSMRANFACRAIQYCYYMTDVTFVTE